MKHDEVEAKPNLPSFRRGGRGTCSRLLPRLSGAIDPFTRHWAAFADSATIHVSGRHT